MSVLNERTNHGQRKTARRSHCRLAATRKTWEQFIEHKNLQHYKLSSLSVVRLESEIAEHLAAEITRLDWRVTHPEAKHLGSPPAWSGGRADPECGGVG